MKLAPEAAPIKPMAKGIDPIGRKIDAAVAQFRDAVWSQTG